MRDLLELRDEIDQIDSQIVDLYERRMAISEEVAEYKIAVGKKVFDKQREVSKLETLSRKGTTPFLKHGIRELFEQIMSMSRKRQYQLLTEHGQTEKTDFKEVDHLNYKNAKIVFQGTEGAYSQLALNEYFGENADSYHVDTWRDAMEAIHEGGLDIEPLRRWKPSKTERPITLYSQLRIHLPESFPRTMILWWNTIIISWASRSSVSTMHFWACRKQTWTISPTFIPTHRR